MIPLKGVRTKENALQSSESGELWVTTSSTGPGTRPRLSSIFSGLLFESDSRRNSDKRRSSLPSAIRSFWGATTGCSPPVLNAQFSRAKGTLRSTRTCRLYVCRYEYERYRMQQLYRASNRAQVCVTVPGRACMQTCAKRAPSKCGG